MKVIARVFIILATAAVIAAIGFAIVQLSGVNQSNFLGGPRHGAEMDTFSKQDSGFPEAQGGRSGHEGGERGANILSVAGLLKNLAVVGVIVLIYHLAGKWIRARKNTDPTQMPASQV